MRGIPQEVQKLVTLVYLAKNNKEKKQKLKKETKKKRQKQIMMKNNRWAGRLVLKISLTDQPIDYI